MVRAAKKGYYVTKWNGQPVPRYRCGECGKWFSSHTPLKTFGQHKPYLNETVFRLYASAMTQRRLAQVLGVNRKTIVRKFLFVAGLSRQAHEAALAEWPAADQVEFDEVLSFEHTRLKPLSIALAVEKDGGRILGVGVARSPCSGKLAAISRRKYGWRPDDRPKARRAVLEPLSRSARPRRLVTDAHGTYPSLVRTLLPNSHHVAVKSRMGPKFRPEGSRKNIDDALFTLNYTAAKFRHDLSRMGRRVWVTTKKAERLQAHLDLYVAFNNGYALPR